MNNLSSFILLFLLILLFCFKSLEISENNFIDSLNIENASIAVTFNNKEDKHSIEKRQVNRNRRQRRARRIRRQLTAALTSISAQITALNQQLSSLQAQVSNLATTTTPPAAGAGGG
ncbi:Hypothetical protein SRAE_0000057800 [Strongyloides ratti]|uniref:Basic-leucine zipper domain-containing protein n=1 Tax=Strongyloides ratti TaxID=34506 RepID=A0A090L1T3_STRRB|nr:Hypothetical protein SRAE_0000057800 [Strongyloides ratti]CEF61454.1 Hypothetical protein SRAE_0000057800 [Strongyloides ratti]